MKQPFKTKQINKNKIKQNQTNKQTNKANPKPYNKPSLPRKNENLEIMKKSEWKVVTQITTYLIFLTWS